MKDNYDFQIKLRCATCGSEDDFEQNDDKSYVKCTKCNREYFGGYDELVELNQAMFEEALANKKSEIKKDIEKDIHDILKKAFKDNKHVKIE